MKYSEVRKQHLQKDNKKRIGKALDFQYITVHNTANPTSTAKNERAWLDNPQNTSTTGWHIVVDEFEAIEAIPLSEVAYHAGDGANGLGNTKSIGIEICESGDYAKTEQNAVELIASILIEKDWGTDRVKPHKHWSSKQCPRIILPYWNDFIKCIDEEVKKEKSNEVSSWAKEAHTWIVKEKISDGTRPKDPITREEVWAMLHRIRIDN
ncbi:N-acetylmuramoyl-L-alanine amidase [Proteiniborus sp. MB09-C3]|uniref:peptidoglycan recognition protein family protein n=1 Tax=Proteiniborus sp. MB09-C3 TaxID=3050072 RepID=UPI00255542F9|nr:N-acetylmuramoyl-L-alanine amidase [Proteiniborus sp. MB09-C3]WIV11364.1 N-acetylmuramoyl-L-alanine amidase [Proteiniborus sp. MB09-C3]